MCRSCSFAIDDEIMRAFEINLLVYYQMFFYDNDLYKYAIKQKLILIDDI